VVSVENIPGMERKRRIKENDGRGKFKYILYSVRTFVNATMFPPPAQQKKGGGLAEWFKW
jgi:hypothetical protein